MASQFGTLATSAEDLGSVPGIHIEWLTPPVTPSLGFPGKCIHRAHDIYTERENSDTYFKNE